MSWKSGGSWGDNSWGGPSEDEWGGSSDDSWGKGGGGSSWSNKGSGGDPWGQGGSSKGDSWGNSKGETKGDSKGSSWSSPKGDSKGGDQPAVGKGAPSALGKGSVVKPPATRTKGADQQQESSWNQEPAWKKQATGDSWQQNSGKGDWQSSGKGGDSSVKGGSSWQQNSGKGADAWQQNAGKGAKGGKDVQAASQKAEEMKKKIEEDKAKKTAEFKAKSEKATRDAELAEKLATPVMEKAKKMLEDEKATAPALKVSVDSLEKQQTKAKEVADAILKDVEEAKKGGPVVKEYLTELQKQMVKANGLKNQIQIVLGKLKPKALKVQQEADAKVKAAKEEQERKAKESRDSASFKPILAKVTKDVAGVEESVNAVSKKADAVVAKAPEKEELDKVTTEIEKSASEAFKKLNTARTDLNDKFKVVTTYAPDAKKTAHAALAELQKKLVDFGKKASVYTAFKKELPKIMASNEALAQVKAKLDGHDKAIMNATKLGDMPKLDKARIEAIDSQLEPVKKAVAEANTMISQKMKMADAVSSLKFTDFKKKGEEMLKKIQVVYTKIKKDRDVIMAEEYIVQANAKFEACEAGWKSCQDAEMPFLTGVEVLEGDQNEQALKDCENAITSSYAAINDLKQYVKSKLVECKTMEKELGETTSAGLNPVMTKITTVETNVTKFKKEHSERKILSVMSTAIDAVEEVEKKVSEVEKHSRKLSVEDMEDESVDAISEAIEKTKVVLVEATTKYTEASKLVKEKSWEAKAGAGNEKIQKINSRMSGAQEKTNKVKLAIQLAEKVVRAKKAISAGEEKINEAEAEVAKVEKFEGSDFTAATVKEFTDACAQALIVIRNAGTVIQPHVAAAPAKAKETLQALLERKNEAMKTVEKLKAETKDAREEVLCNAYLADAEKQTKGAEDATEQMEEAEKPFLLGDLPLAQSLDAIKKCEGAVAAVKQAVTEANKFIDLKSKEVKQFGAAASKKATEGLTAMTVRVKAVNTKSASFDKDLKERTKTTRMAEAGAKADEVEARLKEAVEAAEPFTKEGGKDMSEADAAAPLKVFQEKDQELSKLLVAGKQFMNQRMGEQKTSKENTETLKKLQERLTKVQTEMTTIKKSTASHEQRALGTQMLAEAKEQVGGLDAEVVKATTACGPLIEKAGIDFLVDTSLRTLVAALSAHMKEKDLTVDSLFKEVGKGKAVKEKAFVEYLKKLPEAISHDELSSFDAERCAAIFKATSADGKSLTGKDFTGMFTQTYTCVKPVTLTDRFAADGSETVCKVEMNAEVVLSGAAKEDEAGLLRSEAKVGDAKGWITISQKKGPFFLRVKTKLDSFYQTMDKAVADAAAVVNKTSASVTTKSKPAGNDEGPMKEAKAEIAKLKEKVSEAQKAMDELKKKVAAAKRDYSTKEKSELNAHIEARNMKEAATYLDGPKAKIEALEAAAKDAEDGSAPLNSLAGDELLAFTTPASVLEATEKANAAVTEAANATREACKEQFKAASDVSPQTGGTAEAKKQIKMVQSRIEEAVRKASKCVATAKNNCSKIVAPKLEPTAVAIRKYAQDKKLSGEALFDSFKDGDKITETAFCKLVKSLGESAVAPDVAKLISQRIGKDGITKDAFLNYVVVYYKVTKSIAFTDVLDISKCKTLRKIEIGEVLEMLSEPEKHEGTGTTRIRAKALAEPIVEGWVTMSGNQGSSFLEKTKKPDPKPEKKP